MCDKIVLPFAWHTLASRLFMAGVDLRAVHELMGHKTITITLRYAHLFPDHERAAMEMLEHRFSVPSPAAFHNLSLAVGLANSEKH